MPSYQRALLIVNPVAGHARGLRLGQQLRESLEARGLVCSVRVTNGQGDARRWSSTAAADGFDLIAAIGGDGTVGEVVAGQARAEAKVPIAIVPVGTANVVSLALALPWLPGMAISNMLEGRVLPFDVGYLPHEDRHFFLMAALGFPARVIRDSPRRLKNLFGIFTYMGAALRNALSLDEVSIFIEDDTGVSREFEGNTILLSNVGKIGDINLKVTPDTSAHDGRFDVSVISSRSLWDLLAVLFRMLTWRYRPTQRLHHFQSKRVVITTEPPVAVQIDGEDLGHTPLTAEVIPGGVHLVVGGRYRENPDGGGFLKEFHVPWTAPRPARRWLPKGR
ncbi:MAG: diacylglycerol kinase family lipid kinase [bacterium]|jgi:YegS/Rv2252/BmrU family lipid kinase|nr:diacylglycerol kinase family lipid kinase [bacterium]MBK7671995.1 diacylglycerol kinase family lipid kinase [bacterium]MBK7769298.1 diacylglycerol kinase family lipid kinase [bacterium]MBK9473827.1 diacylglycerol kinase family lipid kinase [bacterium]MBK9774775.1 diacylglycerol kinase family lipid kinase [bacterium]